jgi:hypothetical protein
MMANFNSWGVQAAQGNYTPPQGVDNSAAQGVPALKTLRYLRHCFICVFCACRDACAALAGHLSAGTQAPEGGSIRTPCVSARAPCAPGGSSRTSPQSEQGRLTDD